MAATRVKESLIQSKRCKRCGNVRGISDFFINPQWVTEGRCDAWCKECYKSLQTKQEVKDYFLHNCRQWNEQLFQAAKKTGDDAAEKVGGDDATKQKVAWRETRSRLAILMQRPVYYKFTPVQPDSAIKIDGDDLKYDAQFGGEFTKKELKILHQKYDKLNADAGGFDNETNIDYARKICVTSLQYDNVMNKFRKGLATLDDVKAIQTVFDTLNKSANLAACKRKPGEGGGLTSWAQTTMKLQNSGHPCTRKIEWEKDTVDMVINQFYHIGESLGLGDA